MGDIARQMFDPLGTGHMVDLQQLGFENSLSTSTQLLSGNDPVFEAGMTGGGVLAFADVMLPGNRRGSWRMIEVKSSTSVKDYHYDDIAIQTYAAREAGVLIESVSLAHIDSAWIYPGDNDYQGLFKVNDLTKEARSRHSEVAQWVQQAQSVAKSTSEPATCMGMQCTTPFNCGFMKHCSKDIEQPEYPLNWLPRLSPKVREELTASGITDLREVPNNKLTQTQLRIKHATVTGQPYMDANGAAEELAQYPLPCLFLDFESVQFGVPIWAGTKPYQQICFQFSLHTLHANGQLDHQEFLDLSGEDPSMKFTQALLNACGNRPQSIFVYNATFEKSRIAELAGRFPLLSENLKALSARIVDLMPITKNHYYHPTQKGSWSIKNVLPALVPELSYSDLEGVQDGTLAIMAYLEAIDSSTSPARKREIELQLQKYCQLDTYAMVKIWQTFAQ
ncbi:MAG: DUF2779 domain-containing protein [Limnohabitans sp.]